MKTIFFSLSVLAGTAFLVLNALTANAQLPRLTDIVTVGTTANGDYVTGHDWHTKNLPSKAYGLWVIEGTDINGAFINGPGIVNSAIDLPLTLGSHTFTVYGSANFPDRDYFGINLGFGGSSSPLISAYGPAWTGGTAPFTANPIGSTTRFDDNILPAANTLTYITGNYRVTLTSFWNTKRDFFNIDRVSDFTTSPGGAISSADNIGQFTLNVTSIVPEANDAVLLCCGLPLLLPFTLRRRTH